MGMGVVATHQTKIFRGVTSSVATSPVSIPLGIDSNKIIGLDVLIDYSPDNSGTWIRSTNKSGFQFHVFVESGGANFRIEFTSSQSNNLLSKPYVAIVSYTN